MARIGNGEGGGKASAAAVSDWGESDHERRFWMGLLYVGIAAYVAVSLGSVIYLAQTWSQPNRGAISGLIAIALASTMACYLARHAIVSSPYRNEFFACWNLLSYFFLIPIVLLDGGIGSPAAKLYMMPILFLAIGYTLRVVLICGSLGLASYLLLAVIAPPPDMTDGITIQSTALATGLLLAAMGAVIRERKDRELKRLRQRLATFAATDALTGCRNQRAFTMSLQTEVARAARYQHPLALLLVDVDHFKAINDRHGHQRGDEVLRLVGQALRATGREADLVARHGGDEFALLAPETDRAGAGALAQRLSDYLREHKPSTGITLSIGVHAAVPEPNGVDRFFQRADSALYTAKRRGRDQIAVWEPADVTALKHASP